MKNTVKLNECALRKIVADSVKKVLKEKRQFDNNDKRVDDVMGELLLQVEEAYRRLYRISRNRDDNTIERAFGVVLGCKELFKNNGFNLQIFWDAATEEPSWGAEDEG